MDKKVYNSDELTKAGPYSHAVEAGGLIFISGMLPVDVVGGEKEMDDIKNATRLIFQNLSRALAAAGSSLDKVVKMTVFLRDMEYFAAMNETYATFFPENPPARSCVAVKTIPGNYPVEMEAVAAR